MKWLLRILAALVLLVAIALAGAWFFFPSYAPALLERLTAGKGLAVKLSDIKRPALSGIGFGQLEATLTTEPDSCVTAAATYNVKLVNGSLSWQSIGGKNTTVLALQLDADSVSVRQMPSDIRFRQANPKLRARLDFRKTGGLLPSVSPDSIAVQINNGIVEAGQLRLEEISYDVLLTRSHDWVQQPARFRARSLLSGDAKTPLSDLDATFGLKKNPEKPCTITFTDCSLHLLGLRAFAPQVEFNLRNKRTAFELKVDSVLLAGLSPKAGQAVITGKLSGVIPVEYLDATIRINNGTIDAEKGTEIAFKTDKTTVTFDAGRRSGEPPLIGNLNARVSLDTADGSLSAITLNSLSARLLDGRINSTPARYDLDSGTTAATIKIDNASILDRIRMQGEFSGKLKGKLSGSFPVRLTRNGFAIDNARLSAQGSSSIVQTVPIQPSSGEEELFSKSGSSEVQWDFNNPLIVLNRAPAGKMTLDIKLKSLKRKTGGGELLLTSPKSKLTMFAHPGKPSLLSLSDFSAGLLDGTVAVERMDYDLETKHTETRVQLNGIPIQSLLDLQGASKLSATGTIRATIPLVLDNNAFSIPDGNMDAETSGIIIYSTTPEERAAAGAGMRLTYEALGNFFYSELISTVTMTPDGNSLISIKLKGRNPDFQNNRPVNLNLNIQQNLLDLFRSLTLSSDIEEAISKKVLEKSQKKQN